MAQQEGWREESSLHMRVLHVQLSLNHRSPPPPPFPTFSLAIFSLPLLPLCPYCIPASPLSSLSPVFHFSS